MLVVTDVYLRYVWVKLTRNKRAENVASKFYQILKSESMTPTHVQTNGVNFSLIPNKYYKYNCEIKAAFGMLKDVMQCQYRAIDITQGI